MLLYLIIWFWTVGTALAFIGRTQITTKTCRINTAHRLDLKRRSAWNAVGLQQFSPIERKPLFSASDRTYMSVSNEDDELVLDDFNRLLEAIELFQKVYGDCEIGNKFEVPDDKIWPPSLHGLRLGRRLDKLQSSSEFMQKYPDKVQALAQAGWDPRTSKLSDEFTAMLDALKIYKSMYKNLRVPSKFVVPDADPWPRQSRGCKLGVRVAAVRSAGRYIKENPARKAELDALDFEWQVREVSVRPEVPDEKFDELVRALSIYKEYIDEALMIPTKFVVPKNSDIWPPELYDYRLGYISAGVRTDEKMIQGHPERKQVLLDMGFPFEKLARSHDANKRFENIYAALVVYKQLYGDVMVPQHFMVPSEEPWPEATWGIKLGSRVTAIRSQSTFVSNSPERRHLLDQLGFSWELRSETRKRLGEQEAAEMQLIADKELLSDYMSAEKATSTRRAREVSSGDSSTSVGVGGSPSKRGRVQREDERSDTEAVLGKLLEDIKTRSQLVGQSGDGSVQPPARRSAASLLDSIEDLDLELDEDEAKEVAAFDEELSRLLGPGGVVQRPTVSASVPLDKSKIARDSKTKDSTGLYVYDEKALSDEEIELDALLRQHEAAKLALPFDPTRLFQPEAYRETAAGTIAEYMLSREMSADPKIRQVAHFEGHLTPQDFNEMMARPIEPEDVAYMKQMGYRILEFGPHTFEDVLRALEVYRAHHRDVDPPQDYVITEQLVEEMRSHRKIPRFGRGDGDAWDAEEEEGLAMETLVSGAKLKPGHRSAAVAAGPLNAQPIYDDSLIGMLLGEAVASLRNGDIDGLEDPARRRALDALGFRWGDLTTYQRYRFMPMLLGLRIYRHLYGFPMPQSDFVVPDAPQWPYWMAGMPLGEWASVVRIQQQMVFTHYPDRVDMLNALEFLWWIPPGEGVPAKYYEPVV